MTRARNIANLTPSASGIILPDDLGAGVLLNSSTVYNNTAYSWLSSTWFDLWKPSYTPVSNNSKIVVVASLNHLPEASNAHDLYMVWPGGTGVYYYGTAKASSISGWFQGNFNLIYEANNSSTAAQQLTIQAKGNGANTSYFNYNWGPGAARSTCLFLEFAR